MPRLFAILLLALSTAAHAQATQGGRAPYEGDLQRLSEILGALHYLRDLCGARKARPGATKCRRWSMRKRRAESGASVSSQASTAATAVFSRPIAPARPRRTMRSGAISKRARKSPAISRRATPIKIVRFPVTGIATRPLTFPKVSPVQAGSHANVRGAGDGAIRAAAEGFAT